jgi:ankyrin repeat protein
VRLLLEHEADVDAKIDGGWTVLHEADREGYEAVVRLLLDHMAHVDAKDRNGMTALDRAIDIEHLAVMCPLQEKDVNALHRAAENLHETEVKRLLEESAEREPKDK